MQELYDVIIAGAGPIGLFLACELGLAQISVLVLEQDLTPDSPWKSEPLGRRGLNTVAVESLYRRGLLHKVFPGSKRAASYQKTEGFQFGGHFAGLKFNANKLKLDRWKYRLNGPSLLPGPTMVDHIESVLAERAAKLGVRIVRGCGVTAITAQDHETLTLTAGDNRSFRCGWLVGCDGGRSAVRKAAGIGFVGTEAKLTGYAIMCDWDHPERLKPGFHPTQNGLYIIVGTDSLYLTDFDDGRFDRTQEITVEHVQNIFRRVSNVEDVKITNIHLASTFTDRCKQATTYRTGRVILAGDAAHIHGPVGSQGMNLGMGDAMNLGWKLAAAIQQELQSPGSHLDLTLLDTYEKERYPIGAAVLEWTRAQISILQPDPHAFAVQNLVRDFIDTTDGTNLFIDRHWGLSQRYILGEDEANAHPLVGSSAPDFDFDDGVRLGQRMEGGNGLLVDFGKDTALSGIIDAVRGVKRLEYVGIGAKDKCGLSALLIRPDGIVAWVAEEHEQPSVVAAKAALERWFKS